MITQNSSAMQYCTNAGSTGRGRLRPLWIGLVALSWILIPFGASTQPHAEPSPSPRSASAVTRDADHTRHARHAFSLFDAPKYPADFAHFDYVNPEAPKGGTFRMAAIGSFDNLNPFTIKGQTAAGIMTIYDSLLTASLDEPGTAYGLVAQEVVVADDGLSVRFSLNPKAQFHDGEAITPEDVIWSFNAIRDAHPFYKAYYHDVEKAEQTGPLQVTFYFREAGNRELPLILGQLPILPQHYWTANGRDLSQTTLEAPLGSGPYRVSKITAGRTIILERVENYWGAQLNVNVGRHNFDELRFDYFGDDTVAFEAFKAGELDYREEYSSKNWATGYAAVEPPKGQMIREEIALQNGAGMQAFVLNTRRAPFDDARIREAFNLAYDFEWTNKNLFYGQYARTNSFFEGSELAATGLPSPAELKILEPYRDQLPDQVFTTPFSNPTTDGPSALRKNLRRARSLLTEAGWQLNAGQLEKDGTPLSVEFLLVQPNFERVIAPYIKNLEKLGIAARIRIVDPTQYQNRINIFDFDIIVDSFRQSLSPGNEQRDFWSSAAAQRDGGRNTIGISNPVVDALVDKIIFATSRSALIAATRALDRVLLWGHYVVPQWHAPAHRLAYWPGLSHPDPMPPYGLGVSDLWWRSAPPPYAP